MVKEVGVKIYRKLKLDYIKYFSYFRKIDKQNMKMLL